MKKDGNDLKKDAKSSEKRRKLFNRRIAIGVRVSTSFFNL